MAAEDVQMAFAKELATQSWTFYGIGMFMIVVRSCARWHRVRSASQFAIDDWLMMTAVPLVYTGLVACLNIIAAGGGSNLFPPEQLSSFSQSDIDERIKGSKIVVVSEQCMLSVIWTLKACMLFMFARMTIGTTHIKWIRFVAAYVVFGWVAAEIAFFTACRPFKGYWAVPPPNPQCTTLERFAIVQAVFNISSDMLIIALPIPLIASLSLPLKQRIGLGLLFSMGTFVIIASVLTKYYNLSNIYAPTYMLWYVREASVSVYVTNLPAIWPLLREHSRFLRDTTSSYMTGMSKMPQTSACGNMSSVEDPRSRVARKERENTHVELGVWITTEVVVQSDVWGEGMEGTGADTRIEGGRGEKRR